MLWRKPRELIKCTKTVWLSLGCISVIYILLSFYGSDKESDSYISKANQLTININNRYLNVVTRKQADDISLSREPTIIKTKVELKSTQTRGSVIIEKQPEVRKTRHNDLDIVKKRAKSRYKQGPVSIPSVYTFADGSWKSNNACKPYKTYQGNTHFYIATSISSAGSVKMFVHNRRDAISSTISKRHSFEPGLVDFVLFLLRKDPQLSLLDIGANVGLFTMATALLGRKVIAVDAVIDNIEHVCASVEYQNFSSRVYLINNAFTNSHGKVGIAMGGTGDFGLSHVNEGDINSRMNQKFSKYFKNGRTIFVDAVKLDDLLNLPRFSLFGNMLIKIDVEGNEHRVLQGAKQFMKKKMKYVKGILIEWAWVSGGKSENIILELMTNWNFNPYKCTSALSLLNKKNTKSWPKDVLWLPSDTKLTKTITHTAI